MDSREAACLLAAAVTNPAPEPGHRLAVETQAERFLIERPDAVQEISEHPERIAVVIREWVR